MTSPFTFNHTANEIADALVNIINPDSAPQNPSTKFVTSQGIKTYVDGLMSGIDVSNLDAAKLITENEVGDVDTIATETHLITSRALKAYLAEKVVPTIAVWSIDVGTTYNTAGKNYATGFVNHLSSWAYHSNTEGVDGGGNRPSGGLTPAVVASPANGLTYIHVRGVFSHTASDTSFTSVGGVDVYRGESEYHLKINNTRDSNCTLETFVGGMVDYMREVPASTDINHDCYRGQVGGTSGSTRWDGKLYMYNYGI